MLFLCRVAREIRKDKTSQLHGSGAKNSSNKNSKLPLQNSSASVNPIKTSSTSEENNHMNFNKNNVELAHYGTSKSEEMNYYDNSFHQNSAEMTSRRQSILIL